MEGNADCRQLIRFVIRLSALNNPLPIETKDSTHELALLVRRKLMFLNSLLFRFLVVSLFTLLLF